MVNQEFVAPSTFVNGQIYIMLCNDFQGSLGWFIKWFTKGNYCHAAIIRKPGFVCTQNDVYIETPMQAYLIRSEGLKFFIINNLTPLEFDKINTAITEDLQKPFWNRMYNYLGLLGQALHIPGISMPGQNICSQRDAEYLRLIPRLKAVIPEHPSPADLDVIFTLNPKLFTNIGYWWND